MRPFHARSRRLSVPVTFLRVATLGIAVAVAGCASNYVTPGRGANLAMFGATPELKESAGDPSVVLAGGRQPLASFPTAIAVVRVQASGYRSATTPQSFGRGQYSVLTTRDVEEPAQMDRLAKLPLVAGIVPLNRLLLPENLQSDAELRQAAARLHADMLLIYTLDTTFQVEDKAAPLTVVTLGLSPNQQARVICTASAVLMDTHNGYVYGAAEATERQNQITNAWSSRTAIDEARRRTEAKAFEKLLTELETTWAGVVRTYATNPGAAAQPPRNGAAPAPGVLD